MAAAEVASGQRQRGTNRWAMAQHPTSSSSWWLTARTAESGTAQAAAAVPRSSALRLAPPPQLPSLQHRFRRAILEDDLARAKHIWATARVHSSASHGNDDGDGSSDRDREAHLSEWRRGGLPRFSLEAGEDAPRNKAGREDHAYMRQAARDGTGSHHAAALHRETSAGTARARRIGPSADRFGPPARTTLSIRNVADCAVVTRSAEVEACLVSSGKAVGRHLRPPDAASGAETHVTSSACKSSLALALEIGASKEMCAWLLDMGHERGGFSRDASNTTILHLAALYNRPEVIEACCIDVVADAAQVHHEQSLAVSVPPGSDGHRRASEPYTGASSVQAASYDAPPLQHHANHLHPHAGSCGAPPQSASSDADFLSPHAHPPHPSERRHSADSDLTSTPDVVAEELTELLDWCDNDGKTALHVACTKGHLACVKLLLDLGADIDLSDRDGNTPLHFASMWGRLEIVQHLIERGCAFATKNLDGFSAADYAFTHSIQAAVFAFGRAHFDSRRAARKRAAAVASSARGREQPSGSYGIAPEPHGTAPLSMWQARSMQAQTSEGRGEHGQAIASSRGYERGEGGGLATSLSRSPNPKAAPRPIVSNYPSFQDVPGVPSAGPPVEASSAAEKVRQRDLAAMSMFRGSSSLASVGPSLASPTTTSVPSPRHAGTTRQPGAHAAMRLPSGGSGGSSPAIELGPPSAPASRLEFDTSGEGGEGMLPADAPDAWRKERAARASAAHGARTQAVEPHTVGQVEQLDRSHAANHARSLSAGAADKSSRHATGEGA